LSVPKLATWPHRSIAYRHNTTHAAS
jgi:hypothetical protein